VGFSYPDCTHGCTHSELAPVHARTTNWYRQQAAAVRSRVSGTTDVGTEEPPPESSGELSDELAVLAAAANEADRTTAWKEDGAGGDLTEIVPPLTEAEAVGAWSEADDQPEPIYRQPWAKVAAIATAAITIPVAAVAVVAIPRLSDQEDSAAHTQAPSVPLPNPILPPQAAPLPELDGTYEVVFDMGQRDLPGAVRREPRHWHRHTLVGIPLAVLQRHLHGQPCSARRNRPLQAEADKRKRHGGGLGHHAL
jgi:hypothetical protein